MSTTDAQFQKLLSLADENQTLCKKEKDVSLLMTSLILDKCRVCAILKNPQIEIQQGEKAILIEALFGNNLYKKRQAYAILFCQLGINKYLVADVLFITQRIVRNHHRCY